MMMIMMTNDVRKYITEFIGTFFLVLTIGCTVIGSAIVGHAPQAIGIMLMVMIYAGAHISGAHYNPAVTLGVWLRGRLATANLAPYMLAQVLGAVLAAFVVNYLKSGVIVLPGSFAPAHVFIAEFLFTFALVYVVLNVATARATAGNSFYGLAIGFTVLAGAYAVGSVSGAAFNPAVVISTVLMGLAEWSSVLVYFAANFLGAAAAAITFNNLNPEDK